MTKQTAVILGSLMLGGYLVTKACTSERARSGRQGNYEVSITEVLQQRLAASRQRTTLKRISQEIGQLLKTVWDFLEKNPELRTDGHNVAIYWDDSGEETVEVGVQVVKQFQESDDVVNSAVPAGLVATTAHFGPYSDLRAAHKAVRAWCKQNGYALAGPSWEVYGDWNDDPAKLRTDVFYRVK